MNFNKFKKFYGHEVEIGDETTRTIKVGEDTIKVNLKDYTHRKVSREGSVFMGMKRAMSKRISNHSPGIL
jgi:hypothetical protein